MYVCMSLHECASNKGEYFAKEKDAKVVHVLNNNIYAIFLAKPTAATTKTNHHVFLFVKVSNIHI